MVEFDVEVVGAKRRRRRKSGSRAVRALRLCGRIVRGVMMRPRLVVLAGVGGFVLLVGTPHVGWDYVCRHPKSLGQPCRAVEYCAYYGVQGRRVDFPEYGESCRLFAVLPLDWSGQ